MNRMRFITDSGNAWQNMAEDEALLNSLASGKGVETLRLYTWKSPAVSIGYFQNITEEVNMEYAKRLNVPVVRRITGGGAVYHEYEITYCVVLKERKGMEDIIASYEFLCRPVVNFLKGIRIEAEFAPINDIIVGGRKISGSAQTRRKGVVMQHGTLLVRIESERMFSVLNVGREKIKGKGIRRIEERVTSLEKETGKMWNTEEIINRLAGHFASHFNTKLVKGSLNDFERDKMEKLVMKYKSREWNEMR